MVRSVIPQGTPLSSYPRCLKKSQRQCLIGWYEGLSPDCHYIVVSLSARKRAFDGIQESLRRFRSFQTVIHQSAHGRMD